MHRHRTADVDIGPVTAAVVNGGAVSICYGARLSSSGAEAGVETLDSMRGRGHATAAVAAWATAVRRRGLLPLYSTSWENVASQRGAEKVGAGCFGGGWGSEGVARRVPRELKERRGRIGWGHNPRAAQ